MSGALVSQVLLFAIHKLDPENAWRITRYAEIVETSYGISQAAIFEKVEGFYSQGRRFVVLPMDMELMGRGKVKKSIESQHDELLLLARAHRDTIVPFAAVDRAIKESSTRPGSGSRTAFAGSSSIRQSAITHSTAGSGLSTTGPKRTISQS